MKDSGVSWVGDIPKNWSTIKNKYIINSLYSGGTPSSSDEDLYSDDGVPFVSISDMSSNKIVRTTKKHLTEKGINDKCLKVLSRGTLLYSIYATVGAVSELGIEATINQAILAIDIKSIMHKQFYKYNLHAMKESILTEANGNTQFNLNAGIVREFVFTYPDYFEQCRIADFLDRKCTDIDNVLEKTKASIEEYRKLKQAVITEAVTKGIRGDRPMKDCGIEWIGEIPAEWKTARLKQVTTKIADGTHFSPQTTSDGYPYITAKDVHGIGLDYDKAEKISEESFLSLVQSGCKPEMDDVLLVKDGATTGRVGLINDSHPCVLLSSVAMLHCSSLLSHQFLYYYMQSSSMQEQILVSMAGSAMPRTTLTKIAEYFATIPTIVEQQEIASYLDQKCSEIDSLIESKERFIKELEAYRKSLIYEYVTGKKEVI